MHKKIFPAQLAIWLAAFVLFFVCAVALVSSGYAGNPLLYRLAAALILLALLAGIGSYFSARFSARRICAPINRLDPQQPEIAGLGAELSPLVQHIQEQNTLTVQRLQELRAEHEQQDKMRRDFTANVSHELKTPLTSISGYAEIIRNGIAQPEDVTRFAGKIYDESQRLITLVSDIIKLSQLDDKDVAVQIEELDLYALCQSVISHLELSAKERGVTFRLQGEHLKIRGAEEIVEEMIFNLCDNAVKYNKPGGKVLVQIRQCVDGVELMVSDTGIGIPKEDIPHIFERFFRVDKSHSKEVGGTGLGLSIVKHGAMFMDASVSAESTLGEGTTIRILF